MGRACRCRMSASENSFERAIYNQQEDDICKLGGKSVLPHFINDPVLNVMSQSWMVAMKNYKGGWTKYILR